jgi:hypothetical protein
VTAAVRSRTLRVSMLGKVFAWVRSDRRREGARRRAYKDVLAAGRGDPRRVLSGDLVVERIYRRLVAGL